MHQVCGLSGTRELTQCCDVYRILVVRVRLFHCPWWLSSLPCVIEYIRGNPEIVSHGLIYNIYILIWCPAHIGIIGNEVADFLAKRGAGGVSSMERPPQAFLQSVNFDDAVT